MRPTSRARRALPWMAGCAVLAFAIPIVVMAQSEHRSGSLPRVASSFGPPPAHCPVVDPKLVHMRHNNQPNSIPPTITWVQGGALAGYSGWEYLDHRLALSFGTRTKYGYAQKIFWQRTAGAPAQVALSGWNLRTKQRIWFGIPLPDASSTSLAPPRVIAWPSGLVRSHSVHIASAPTITLVPAAGCYVIKAQWRGGSWTVPFAAGS